MAREINFLKLYNKLDSPVYRLYSSPSTYLSLLGIGAIALVQNSLNETWSSASIAALPIMWAMLLDLRQKLQPIDKIEYILNKIKKTSEYKECIALYNDYLKRIVELFQRLHIKDTFTTCNLLNLMLKNGFFSVNAEYNFHNYKNELLPIDKLSGARILSGTGVCRHEAAFITDILNNMGYKAAIIVVTKTGVLPDDIDELDLNKINGNMWNHAVVGIAENGKKVLFDSVASSFAGCIPSLNITSSSIATLFPEIKNRYVFINPSQTIFYEQNDAYINEFMRLPLMELNLKLLEKAMYDSNDLLGDNIELFINFQSESQKQVEQIAKLEKKIIPYSDDEVVTWKVK